MAQSLIPEFLREEISVRIEDYTRQGGTVTAHIECKTKRPFAPNSLGTVVPPDVTGVRTTTLVAKDNAELESKLKHLFFDIYYFYFRPWPSHLDSVKEPDEPPQILAIRKARENETVSVSCLARCTEWRELKAAQERPWVLTVLYEIDDHPVLGNAEVREVYTAHSERGLADTSVLVRTLCSLATNKWTKPGTLRRPDAKPHATFTAKVRASVKRKDLPRRKPKTDISTTEPRTS